MKIKKVCLICSQEFVVFRHRQNTAKYCSKECLSKREISKETREKMSKKKLGSTPWNKGKRFTQMNNNKHAYKGDTATKWAGHKRAQKVIGDKKNCERCGTTKQLVIHHKNENPLDNRKKNLERLCRACHINHHRKSL